MNNFTFLSSATKGRQISMDIIPSRKIKNFENFKFQGCNAPQMEAENMYNSNQAWKSRGFFSEKVKIFKFDPIFA